MYMCGVYNILCSDNNIGNKHRIKSIVLRISQFSTVSKQNTNVFF